MSLAGEPQPWGIHLQWLENQSDSSPIAASVSPLTVQRSLSASAARIEALEGEWGPYAPELTPVLTEAAREAEEYGETDTALDLYRWALHSTRINRGLSTADQLPLLERMLGLLRDRGDREALSNQIDYFYRLLGRGAQPWTEQRLNASVRWLSVQGELLASAPWRGRESEVLFVLEHASDLAEAVCSDDQWSTHWCKPLTLELVKLFYLLDYRIDPLVVDEFGVARDRYNSPYQQNLDQSPGEYRLRSMEKSARSRVRGFIDRALELAPGNTELLLAKGDWLLARGRRSQALEIYAELNDRGDFDFSSPRPVPEIPALGRDRRLSDATSVVNISARVTARGDLRDLDVSEPGIDEKPLAGYAKRQLREVRIRPALDGNGEPQDAVIHWQVLVTR